MQVKTRKLDPYDLQNQQDPLNPLDLLVPQDPQDPHDPQDPQDPQDPHDPRSGPAGPRAPIHAGTTRTAGPAPEGLTTYRTRSWGAQVQSRQEPIF